jgi:hypothetical protein
MFIQVISAIEGDFILYSIIISLYMYSIYFMRLIMNHFYIIFCYNWSVIVGLKGGNNFW